MIKNDMSNDYEIIKSIISFKKDGIKILLPEGYYTNKDKNIIINGVKSLFNKEKPFRKIVETSDNMVIISPINYKEAMDYEYPNIVIDVLHKNMSEKQGIIEVKNGKTKDGYDYIYFIIKQIDEKPELGVSYILTLHLFYKKEIIEVYGWFKEINMTGGREALAMALAQKSGIIDLDNKNIDGWFKDPYDENYKRGALKNLAEYAGMDALLPFNPLSQARELLLAILNHQYVVPIENIINEIENAEKRNNIKHMDEKQAKELWHKIFSDDGKRRIIDIPVV